MPAIHFMSASHPVDSRTRQSLNKVKFGADSPSSDTLDWDDWDEIDKLIRRNDTLHKEIKVTLNSSQYPSLDEDEFRKTVQDKVNKPTTDEMVRMHRKNRIDQIEVDLRLETHKQKVPIVTKLKDIQSRLVNMLLLLRGH